jgi:hypothetical protein
VSHGWFATGAVTRDSDGALFDVLGIGSESHDGDGTMVCLEQAHHLSYSRVTQGMLAQDFTAHPAPPPKPPGLLMARRTGRLFEMLGRTEEGPRQPFATLSAFASDGFLVLSDEHLVAYFTAWPVRGGKDTEVEPPTPMGCRWCGHVKPGHYRWPTQPVGYHLWAQPTAEQMRRRMELRHVIRPSRRHRRVMLP